jgi:hypothetical protein
MYSDNKVLIALMGCEPGIPLAMVGDVVGEESEYRVMSILSSLYDREIISIIGWAKHVPG